MINSYLNLSPKFRKFLVDDCLKNISSQVYENQLNFVLEEIISEIYAKMTSKDKA